GPDSLPSPASDANRRTIPDASLRERPGAFPHRRNPASTSGSRSRKPKNPWIVSSPAEKPVRACPATLSKLKRRYGHDKAPETLSGLLRRMAPGGRHAAEVRSRRILPDVEDVA